MSYRRMYEAYVDGASSGVWGPGGWGVVLKASASETELSGAEAWTTNSRMELMAAIIALEHAEPNSVVTIYSDAAYVINGMRQRWYTGWKKRGWIKSDGEPVMNRDLWERLLEAKDRQNEVLWVKVKSFKPTKARAEPPTHHQAEHFRADRLAVNAKEKLKKEQGLV